jgi:hypothetical protein
MKTLLLILAGFLYSQVQPDKITVIKSGSIAIKGRMSGSSFQQDQSQFRDLVNILNSDVYGYYSLKNQYDNDQKRKAYEVSDDFKSKYSELERLRSQLLSSSYYLDYQPVYNDARSLPLKYDPTSKSLSVMNEVDLNNFYDDQGFIQLDKIVFKYPEVLKVREVNTSTECLALVDETISFEISDPVLAAKILDDKNNLRLLFVLSLKGLVPVRNGIKDSGPEGYCMLADLRELIVYNSGTNEIYSVYR